MRSARVTRHHEPRARHHGRELIERQPTREHPIRVEAGHGSRALRRQQIPRTPGDHDVLAAESVRELGERLRRPPPVGVRAADVQHNGVANHWLLLRCADRQLVGVGRDTDPLQ